LNNELVAERAKLKKMAESKQSIKNSLSSKFNQLRSENNRLQSLNSKILKTQKSLTEKEMKIAELHNAIGLVKNLGSIRNCKTKEAI